MNSDYIALSFGVNFNDIFDDSINSLLISMKNSEFMNLNYTSTLESLSFLLHIFFINKNVFGTSTCHIQQISNLELSGFSRFSI
jgi:hypothetical protein